jgi:molybdopterin-guanine dinucleotide biosynthesis protein A
VLVAGAILTGGRSRRFGRDKALETVDGVAMVERVAGALRAGGIASVAAVGGDSERLSAFGLSVWPDAHPGEGPLGGVLTALTRTDAALLVVVACDLPWLDGETIRRVVAAAGPLDVDVGVAWTDRPEPLLAAWRTRRCLAAVAQAFASGERAVHAALAGLRCAPVPVAPSVVHNVNRPGDLPR